MKKILVVVDMQKDFIDGALGSPEAAAIVPHVVEKIRSWDGDLAATLDTHGENYLDTNEGRHLPVVHCVEGTPGHALNDQVAAALDGKAVIFQKPSFGSAALTHYLAKNQYDYVEFVGLCTDICVVSNAIMAKAALPESRIAVDASCCAGVTPESHRAALTTMNMCQIDILGQ